MPTEPPPPVSPPVEQLSRIRAIRDEWFAVGTRTGPADRTAAQAAITALYRQVGAAAPTVVWADSPLEAVRIVAARRGGRVSLRHRLQQAVESELSSLDEPSWATLLDAVRGDEAAMRWASVWSQLGTNPAAALWSATRTSLGQSLETSVGVTLAAALRAELGELASGHDDPVRGDIVDDALWGQQDAGWIAFHDARRRLGMATFTASATAHLDRWADLARSCGWWWPYEGLCVASERPAVLRLEPWPLHDAHRLHCADGPAMRFGDGWQVHAWHGTRVPSSFVDGDWSVADILAEPAFEVRHRAIQRMGWDRFLTGAAFAETARAPAPEDGGMLVLYDVPDRLFGQPARMLVWTPADPGHDGDLTAFAMAVPAALADPVAAFDWTWEHEDELRTFEFVVTTGAARGA